MGTKPVYMHLQNNNALFSQE